jgi:hypothetical protein
MSLTKASYAMIKGSAIDVKSYGAVGLTAASLTSTFWSGSIHHIRNSITTIRLSDGRHRQEQYNGFRKSNHRRQD